MSQFFETATRPDTAAGAIGQHLRVKTSGALVVAGSSDVALGTMENPCTAAGPCTVRLSSAQGTRKMVASGVISKNDVVYAAASGKISASGTVIEGRALEAASADGDVIEVLPLGDNTLDAGTVTESGTQTLTNKTLTSPAINGPTIQGGNVALTKRIRTTTANVNSGATLLAAVTGYKYRISDITMISVGGAASGATTVDVLGTQSSSGVKLLAVAVAALTQSAVVRAGATNATVLADGASFAECDTNTAVTIGKTGSSLATSTNIDVIITYELIAA